MAEEQFIERLTRLAKLGTETLNIRGSKFTEEESFEIVSGMSVLSQDPVIVTDYIVPLLRDSVKQYNGDIVKISRTILDTPRINYDNNMRHFTLYLLGKNFKDSCNKMSTDEQEKYVINIAPEFGVSEDRVYDILKYLTTDQSNIERPVHNFGENEMDFMMLLRGLF